MLKFPAHDLFVTPPERVVALNPTLPTMVSMPLATDKVVLPSSSLASIVIFAFDIVIGLDNTDPSMTVIAELVAQSSTQAELLEAYPRLTAEMIRLAPVYAAAYPLRGRPRNQPWRDQKPVRQARRRVDTIAVS